MELNDIFRGPAVPHWVCMVPPVKVGSVSIICFCAREIKQMDLCTNG